jgi:S1-C subfamily serine protease
VKSKNKVATMIATLLITIFLLSGCTSPAEVSQTAAPNNEVAALAENQTETAVTANPIAQSAVDGTLASIYEQVNPSVVHIQVVQQLAQTGLDESQIPQIPNFPNFPFSQLPQGQIPLQGEGSGFVWDGDGHIVTNNHVVAGASEINVIFADDRAVEATVVGTDPDSDLAVLKVDVPADMLRPVQLGDSTAVRVGDLAIAIGDPFGQDGTMTVGIISALGRLLPTDLNGFAAGPSFNIPDIIQTDAAINPGNSGGVLLNAEGEVIGVTSAIVSPARTSSGIGFAIPSALVQKVVPALITDGRYEHPYLGISGLTLTPDIAQAMDLPAEQQGALVGEVVADGPADQAGLQGSDRQVEIDGTQVLVGGDVITAIDSRPVSSMDDLITNLGRYGEVGQESTLTILRDDQEQSITVTLAARPQSQVTETAVTGDNPVRLGIIGMALTPEIAEAMDLTKDQQGVLIVQIQADSAADRAGLRGSDRSVLNNGQQMMVGGDVITAVDGQTVSDVPEVQAIVTLAQPGDELELTILRDGEEMEVVVTLGE